jgi:hypothetical protein
MRRPRRGRLQARHWRGWRPPSPPPASAVAVSGLQRLPIPHTYRRAVELQPAAQEPRRVVVGGRDLHDLRRAHAARERLSASYASTTRASADIDPGSEQPCCQHEAAAQPRRRLVVVGVEEDRPDDRRGRGRLLSDKRSSNKNQ